MLRINLMGSAQADALVSFFGERVKELVASGVLQKDIAKAVGLSTAQVSKIAHGKVVGMRLHNVELLAGYLKMTMLDALVVALGRGGDATRGTVRDMAMNRLRGLLDEDVDVFVRSSAEEQPGRVYTELDWIEAAIEMERSRRYGIIARMHAATSPANQNPAHKHPAEVADAAAPMSIRSINEPARQPDPAPVHGGMREGTAETIGEIEGATEKTVVPQPLPKKSSRKKAR